MIIFDYQRNVTEGILYRITLCTEVNEYTNSFNLVRSTNYPTVYETNQFLLNKQKPNKSNWRKTIKVPYRRR